MPILAAADKKWHPVPFKPGTDEFIDLGDAPACAKSLAALPAMSADFKVEKVAVRCHLPRSADCSETEGLATVSAGGVQVETAIVCTNDVASIPTAHFDGLVAFLASKPARLLVKLGTEYAVHLYWSDPEWELDGYGELPRIGWAPKGTVMHARLWGEHVSAFFPELGVDPAGFVDTRHGCIDVPLDFAGKVVK